MISKVVSRGGDTCGEERRRIGTLREVNGTGNDSVVFGQSWRNGGTEPRGCAVKEVSRHRDGEGKGREADICRVVKEQQGALCKWSGVPVCRGGEARGDRRKGAIRDHGSDGEGQVVGNILGYLGTLAWPLSQAGTTTGEL